MGETLLFVGEAHTSPISRWRRKWYVNFPLVLLEVLAISKEKLS